MHEEAEFYQRLATLSPRTPITYLLLAGNVLIYVLISLASGHLLRPSTLIAVHWGGNYGPLTLHGQGWRLLSCMFIHFGLLHIAFNMFALYQIGPLVERIYGSLQYAAIYLFAGICGSALSLCWNPNVNGGGASGAIFGVLGALFVFMANRRNAVPRSVMKGHLIATSLFIAYNLIGGFLEPGVDNSAHIGGLLGGAAAGLILARPLQAEARRHSSFVRLASALTIALLIGAGAVYGVRHAVGAA